MGMRTKKENQTRLKTALTAVGAHANFFVSRRNALYAKGLVGFCRPAVLSKFQPENSTEREVVEN
jgi:hypothetical protein